MKIFPQRKAITDSLENLWFTKQKGMRIGYITILGLTEIYKPCEKYNHQRHKEDQEKTTQHCVITYMGKGCEEE